MTTTRTRIAGTREPIMTSGLSPDEFPTGLAYDDVLLVPAYSEVLPRDVAVRTALAPGFELPLPLISSPMDTVTESRLAIAIARLGGLGIIHRNMPVKRQVEEIVRVKRSESGMIHDPITLTADRPIAEALEFMAANRISGIPIVDNGTLIGIITNRDLRFHRDLSLKIGDVMTRDNLITCPPGTDLEAAKDILHQNRIEKLPIVDDHGKLVGMITVKDIMKRQQYPDACKDGRGRLRVGAAIGVGDEALVRAKAVVAADVDCLCIDASHGHTASVCAMIAAVKKHFPDMLLLAGNVATAEGARALRQAGADVIKVGIGPGSICTTRVITGCGVPQLSAIQNAVAGLGDSSVPVVADGGVRFSGDITKALAAGAHAVMIGSLFAGTDESPGESVLYEGRRYKVYRGMGSLGAMKEGTRDRYAYDTADVSKIVPEGIEGRVEHKGELEESVDQLVGGLRAGMGICGCPDLTALRKTARFTRITESGRRESHPHDVSITKEAPNYRVTR